MSHHIKIPIEYHCGMGECNFVYFSRMKLQKHYEQDHKLKGQAPVIIITGNEYRIDK